MFYINKLKLSITNKAGMSRIMLLGMSPLPFENDKKVYGTGIRTWQFTRSLLEKGHDICLVTYAIRSAYPKDYISEKNYEASYEGKSFKYICLNEGDFEDISEIKKIYEEFSPDCLIGCTFYPSNIAATLLGSISLEQRVPFWADLFGHVMAEAQARAFIDGSDDALFHYWNGEYNILTCADMFSCVSERQSYALIGELGAAGRLNRYSAGYEFTNTIYCGMPQEDFRHDKNVIRGRGRIGKDDFVILWTGGYNTWTDIDTLFKALTDAMSQNERIFFVSTGAEIPEQDIKTYPRFCSLIESSPFRDRFLMNGWIDGRDVHNYYLEADVGINIDKDIYEVKFGSKNRILDWMRAGLLTLSSNVCELTDIIEKNGLGYTFRPYKAEELAAKILYIAEHRRSSEAIARKAKAYALENFSFQKTTEKLCMWAQDPSFSPDAKLERKMLLDREESIKNFKRITSNQTEMIDQKDKRIRELESIVQKGFIYKAYAYLKILKRKVLKR